MFTLYAPNDSTSTGRECESASQAPFQLVTFRPPELANRRVFRRAHCTGELKPQRCGGLPIPSHPVAVNLWRQGLAIPPVTATWNCSHNRYHILSLHPSSSQWYPQLKNLPFRQCLVVRPRKAFGLSKYRTRSRLHLLTSSSTALNLIVAPSSSWGHSLLSRITKNVVSSRFCPITHRFFPWQSHE